MTPLKISFSILFAAIFANLCQIAPAYAQLNSSESPFELEADDIAYDETGKSVTASGNVVVIGQNAKVEAEKIIYNSETGALFAEGNVLFTDAENNVLRVEKLELTGDMKAAVLEKISFRLPDLGEILTASRAEKRDEHIYELYDITYSPCKNCVKGEKPWQIRAKSVKYDAEEEVLTYKSAKLDVLGVPVLYLPYFYHPVGEKPKTGLLPPLFGTSTARGEEITLSGYVFDEPSNSDYTIRTRLMTERGAQLFLERRQKALTWDSELRGSYIQDSYTESARGHAQIIAENTPQKGIRYGLNGEISSDDDYLYDYYERNDAYLPSTLYVEKADQDLYLAAYARWYQDLDSAHSPEDTSQALPSLLAEKIWNLDDSGGQVALKGNIFSLYRDKGNKYQRLSSDLTYSKPFLMQDGSLLDVTASIHGDLYYLDGVSTASSDFSGRVIPEATLGWEKPFVSKTGYHTISPRVMGVLSPRGGNPDDIPNEDSVAYELDVTNLFQSNRFAGLDRRETGPQLIYGLDNKWGYGTDKSFQVFFGQSVRYFNDDALPSSGGTSTQGSDWIGFVSGEPFKWLEFSSSFRLDNSDFTSRRQDSYLTLGADRTEKTGRFVQLSHTYLDGGPEELNVNGRWTFNEKYASRVKLQRDLEAGDKDLLSEIGLIYTHECFRVNGIIRRRGFENSTTQPSTDYLVNVELLTLGRDRE